MPLFFEKEILKHVPLSFEMELPLKREVLTLVPLLVVWRLAKLTNLLVPLFLVKEILMPVLLSFKMEVPLKMNVLTLVPLFVIW